MNNYTQQQNLFALTVSYQSENFYQESFIYG